MSAPRYVQYLNQYCDHFELWPHIRLQTKVVSVSRSSPDRHRIVSQNKSTGETEEWECDAVAVCSGLHVTPNIPTIPRIEKVPEVFHSSAFKSREQFGRGKTVLSIGSGETGADIAYLAVTSPTKRVVMCHRNGFHLAPKVR